MLFETTGVFVSGSNFFRKDSLYSHEKSASHVKNVVRFDAKKDPSKSVAAATLRKLNDITVKQLCIKFTNAEKAYAEFCSFMLELKTNSLSNYSVA